MSFSVTALHYATQQVPGPQALFQSGWDDWVTFNFYAFLLRDGDLNVLVDCGIDDLGALNDFVEAGLGSRGLIVPTTRERRLAALLAREGLRPEDIDVVAFTHFHADHVGNARLFPRASFLVSAEGWRAHQHLLATRPQMVPDPVFPAGVLEWLAEVQEERVLLSEDGATKVPGLSVRHIGGHTADSAALMVETGEGQVLIPGDTIWTYRNLEDDVPIGAAVDIGQCYAAMEWARGLGATVLPCHDPLILDRFPGGVVACA